VNSRVEAVLELVFFLGVVRSLMDDGKFEIIWFMLGLVGGRGDDDDDDEIRVTSQVN